MQDSVPCHRMWRCNGAFRCHRSATLIQWTVLLASSLHGVRAIERNRLIRTDSAAASPIIRGPRRAADSAAGGVLLDVETKEAVSIDAHADVSSSDADRTSNATSIAVFLPDGELALQTHTDSAPSKLHKANKSWKRPHVPLRRPLVRPQSAMQVNSDATLTTPRQVFGTKSAEEELIALSDRLAPDTRNQIHDDKAISRNHVADEDFMQQEPATVMPVAAVTAAPVAAAPAAAGAVVAAPAVPAAAPVAGAAPAVAAAAPVAGAAPAVAAAAPADGTAPVAAAAPADGAAPYAGAAPVPADGDEGSSWFSYLFFLVFVGGVGGGAFLYWKKKQSSQMRGRLGAAADEPEGQGFKAKRSTYRKAVLEKGDEESGSDNSEDDATPKATSSAVGAGSEFSRPTSSRNRGAASAAGSAASGGEVKEKDSTGGSQGSRSYKDRRANK